MNRVNINAPTINTAGKTNITADLNNDFINAHPIISSQSLICPDPNFSFPCTLQQQEETLLYQKYSVSYVILMLMLLLTYPFDVSSFLLLRMYQKMKTLKLFFNWVAVFSTIGKLEAFNPTYPFSVFVLWNDG